jgi:zinc D-Ala-D-Ala dipeptidase
MLGSPEPIAALNRVCIREAAVPWDEREPLVDIRAHCSDVLFAPGICPFLRLRPAEMLKRAQAALRTGIHLRVATALRTATMQMSGWDRYFARMKEENPAWPLSALRRATNKYHAPYDQKAPPGHCTGGAVDVVLVDAADQPLDVTSPTEGWDAAYTWSDKLSPEARANRMILVEAMLGAGFSNCRDEYWHYSWGDSAWAVRVGETECPYGWAHPPVCLETDFAEATAAVIAVESRRDVNGRVIEATAWCAPSLTGGAAQDAPVLRVGLYWAKGVPVTLNIGCPPTVAAPALYAGPALDQLETVPAVDRSPEGLVVRITPEQDRTILSTVAPPPATAAA